VESSGGVEKSDENEKLSSREFKPRRGIAFRLPAGQRTSKQRGEKGGKARGKHVVQRFTPYRKATAGHGFEVKPARMRQNTLESKGGGELTKGDKGQGGNEDLSTARGNRQN